MTKKKFKRKIGLLIRDCNVLNYERDQQESAISFLKKSVKVLEDTNQRLNQQLTESNLRLKNEVGVFTKEIETLKIQVQFNFERAELNLKYLVDAKEQGNQGMKVIENRNRELVKEVDSWSGQYVKTKKELENAIKNLADYDRKNVQLNNEVEKYLGDIKRLRRKEQELSAAHDMITSHVMLTQEKYQELLQLIPKTFSFEEVKKYEPRGRADNSPCKNCGQMKWNHAVGYVCKKPPVHPWDKAVNPKDNFFQNEDGSLKGGIPFGGLEDWYEREARKFNEDIGQLGYQIHIPTTCTCGHPMQEHLIEIKMTCPKDLKNEEQAKPGEVVRIKIIQDVHSSWYKIGDEFDVVAGEKTEQTMRGPISQAIWIVASDTLEMKNARSIPQRFCKVISKEEPFFKVRIKASSSSYWKIDNVYVVKQSSKHPDCWIREGAPAIKKSCCEVTAGPSEENIQGFWPKEGTDMICRNCGKTREEHLHSRICI